MYFEKVSIKKKFVSKKNIIIRNRKKKYELNIIYI